MAKFFPVCRHKQCTTLRDPNGQAWCSTSVDSKGDHVGNGGHWGHCSQECLDERLDGGELDKALEAVESTLRSGFRDCPCLNYKECQPVNSLVQLGRSLLRTDPR